MTKHPGMGVMINALGGNAETVEAVRSSLNKIIKTCVLKKSQKDEDQLRIEMKDGSTLVLYDNGQSCCENRYMNCDDDLTSFADSILLDVELAEGPDVDDGESHEQQFLRIHTNAGIITVVNHNEHNGYYGGFAVVARTEST